MKKPEGNTHKNGKVFSVYSLINHFTLKHVRTYVHTYIHTYKTYVHGHTHTHIYKTYVHGHIHTHV